MALGNMFTRGINQEPIDPTYAGYNSSPASLTGISNAYQSGIGTDGTMNSMNAMPGPSGVSAPTGSSGSGTMDPTMLALLQSNAVQASQSLGGSNGTPGAVGFMGSNPTPPQNTTPQAPTSWQGVSGNVNTPTFDPTTGRVIYPQSSGMPSANPPPQALMNSMMPLLGGNPMTGFPGGGPAPSPLAQGIQASTSIMPLLGGNPQQPSNGATPVQPSSMAPNFQTAQWSPQAVNPPAVQNGAAKLPWWLMGNQGNQ